MQPKAKIARLEETISVPLGDEERFSGYGVMGLPFASGHILALRRFPASSLGAGYTSIWHRRPDGAWLMYTDVTPELGCPRYFGEGLVQATRTPIVVSWPGERHLRVTAPEIDFEWDVTLRPSPGTRMMNGMGALMPELAWRSSAVLRLMGVMAGWVLRLGRVGLIGLVPNGQTFRANPRHMWRVAFSRAVLAGEDFGPPGPVRPQARLGDFWIPQQGMVALGQTFFEPLDRARHSARLSQAPDSEG